MISVTEKKKFIALIPGPDRCLEWCLNVWGNKKSANFENGFNSGKTLEKNRNRRFKRKSVKKMSSYRRSGFLAQLLRIVGGFEATRKRKNSNFGGKKCLPVLSFVFNEKAWQRTKTTKKCLKIFLPLVSSLIALCLEILEAQKWSKVLKRTI
jgi:hypothetical protein